MDESYYRRNQPARPMQHPSRQVPLPEPPAVLATSTLGRRVGGTAASTRAGHAAPAYRSRADSESLYSGAHFYDSTDNYYSGANYGGRPRPGPSGELEGGRCALTPVRALRDFASDSQLLRQDAAIKALSDVRKKSKRACSSSQPVDQ